MAGKGQAYFQTVNYLANITTGTTIAGSPTHCGGCAFASFQIIGLGTGAGGSGAGGGQGNVIIQGTLGMPAVGSSTWVAVSVTNLNNNQLVGAIVADSIYTLSTNQGPQAAHLLYVRPMVTTLSNVENGRLDVTGMIESQTSSW